MSETSFVPGSVAVKSRPTRSGDGAARPRVALDMRVGHTNDLISQVEQAAPAEAGFEETVAALAAALWRTLREQPTSHQLLTELSMFALRTPRLQETLEGHYREVTDVTTRLVTEVAERTGHQLAQPAKTLARFFLAGFDGLSVQHLSLPDEEAELTCLQAPVSAVVALAGGRMEPTS